jgi:membrane-associated progesterone receptor component
MSIPNGWLIGTVFDVSSKADVYGSGKSYNVFAGKDGSRGLALSSLKAKDAVADYRGLNEKEMVVLNDWRSFFSYVFFTLVLDSDAEHLIITRKRYNIVGKVIDGPVPDAVGLSSSAPSNL